MKRLLAFMLITFAATAPLSAQDIPGKQAGKPPFLVSFGTNLSFYPGEEGESQLGYSLGITFNFRVHRNLSMTIPLSYTRINAALENVEGSGGAFFIGDTIYKTLSDWQVSAAFFEVPLLFIYKFPTKNSYDFGFVFGPGLAFAIKDFSKLNFMRTDEMIGIEQDGLFSIDPSKPDLRSTLNIITGVRLHINRFYLDLLYTFYSDDIKIIYKLNSTPRYPTGIKTINNLNSISVKLGIDIF